MKLMPLPELTENEFHILLMGLDELPAKISRMLHRKLTDHALTIIKKWDEEKEQAKKYAAHIEIMESLKDQLPKKSVSTDETASQQ